jgi:F-type H+-transporting ATPase subunit epsilon
MADLIELEVATPERLIVREGVADVQVPGKDGYLGILPGHAPLLGLLGTGVLSYGMGGSRRYLAVHGGFIEVLPDHVRVLATVAQKADEVNVEKAAADLRRAQEQLTSAASSEEADAALDSAADAQSRIEAAEKK